jgi:macrolide-specific efflux system membrane fusion protein
MTANLTIVTQEVQNAVLVPNVAVTTTAFGSYVTTVGPHDQLVRTPVQTGISDLVNTQILSGLRSGERIIEPLGTLRTGGTGGGGRGGFGGGFGGRFGGGFGGGLRGGAGG